MLTLRGPKGPRRGSALEELAIIHDGSLLVRDGVLQEVGPTRRVENLALARNALEISAGGRVVMPGFVDSHTRLLLKGSIDLGADFNPELLFYREGNQNKFGLNLTRSLGQKIVAYTEWAGGERSNLIDQALAYGRQTGALPSSAAPVLPDDHNIRFSHDLSTGASYTTTNKITFNVEYHFHEAGFSGQNWNNWFNAGQGQTSSSFIASELWYIRNYALDQQEPLARNSAFLRADWVDAFVPDLEITGFVNTDLHDGSSLVQVAADYYISNAWTVGAQVNANIGSGRSDFGSLPQSVGILFKIARYF